MQSYKLEKDFIFYIPGHPGPVFTYKEGHAVSDTDIQDMKEHLKRDTGHNIGWVEDRRLWDRPPESSDMRDENNMDIVFI